MRNYLSAKKGTFLLLHISLLFSSLSGVCSKMASRYTDHILSISFLFWFGLVFVIMFGYAIIWQQILKRMPLTVAYANKPVTLIWGIIWGSLIFGENAYVSEIRKADPGYHSVRLRHCRAGTGIPDPGHRHQGG